MIEQFLKDYPETELVYERASLWWDESESCWVVYHAPYRKRRHCEYRNRDLAKALVTMRKAGEE